MGRRDFNWNEAEIENHDGPNVPLTEPAIPSEVAAELGCRMYAPGFNQFWSDGKANDITGVGCYSGNLEGALAHFIEGADFVFACFAWLTNHRILDSLAGLEWGCQIVVQKEDFLRPDWKHSADSYAVLRNKYEKLRCDFDRRNLPNVAGGLSMLGDQTVAAVRCAGVANTDRRKAAPRMHHKFAVACKCTAWDETETYGDDSWTVREVSFSPLSVWTGSFNPTSNGTRSRENAVVINSPTVAGFYLREWAKVFAVSEPLDWLAEWSSPEWRIGT